MNNSCSIKREAPLLMLPVVRQQARDKALQVTTYGTSAVAFHRLRYSGP